MDKEEKEGLQCSQAPSFTKTPNFECVWLLAPPVIPGSRPKCVSHNQPTTMTSSSQGKWLNYSISCQSEEERTNRLLGLFFSDPGKAVVVMQLETLADSTNARILKEEIKKKKKESQQSYLQLTCAELHDKTSKA